MTNLQTQELELPKWILSKVTEARADGVVFGMSGGIDSAVLSTLCAKALGDKALGIIMPCYSNPKDELDARLIAKTCLINITKVDLDEVFDLYAATLNVIASSDLVKGNIKARLRMITLYAYANSLNYLVAGSDDFSENYMGYFTKYGDSACDIAPLACLLKTEVQALGRLIGVPEEICSKPPSPGLWSGQTAENEMGISYKDIDNFLSNFNPTKHLAQKMINRHINSEHKRNMPAIPNINKYA